MNLFRRMSLIAIIALLIYVYISGAVANSQKVNLGMNAVDQSAYMNYSIRMFTTNYAYVGGRNRMPVYPFLQSLLLYNPEIDTEEEFFIFGKYFNIFLSLLILLTLFLVLRKHISVFESSVLLLITAFSVFAYKAAYFQCELLYYFLFFCSFLQMLFFLKFSSLKRGVLLGFLLAITYLTKASILAGILIFVFFLIIKAILALMHSEKKIFFNIFKGFVVASTVFFIIVGPYIVTSKARFGKFFYNVNTTFYFWNDSWEEVSQQTKAHGDRVGWPNMPDDQIPSMRKYIKDHSAKQIWDRITNGVKELADLTRSSYGYYKYFVIYSILFLLMMPFLILREKEFLTVIKRNIFEILFSITYIISHFVLSAWYTAIAYGDRIVLSIFLIYMFCIFLVLSQSQTSFTCGLFNRKLSLWRMFNLFILLLISYEIVIVFPYKISSHFGGF